ncbi:DedA family protein [Anaerobacillus isosaccharinicus]|uniref:DedA family protein n=1 Tax=Anaerobacillus isosaccharinicus TaxID=1532552 RepID=A0A7S7L8K2_9BACI|nr:DedA family protein [Anaerobacillus isosaccharinicus]MBA5585205.1 DedA family protein [Anaerobacillus isosaccharinicus]QOY36459.1 DedA family protein [Anaerobacillus isosaccharinicus]
MENLIIDIVERFGYVGIFLLIMLENIFPPIPSEVILTFGGFMTTTTNLSVLGVVTASTFGSVFGAVILYGIGSFINISKIEKFVDKWGYIFRLTKGDLNKANAWFLKYGVWTVFFCRFIPLIRSLISIPAGMVKMNFGLFLMFTTLGTIIWNFTLVLIGTLAGRSWATILSYMDLYSNILYVVMLIVLVLLVLMFIKKKYMK